MPARARSSRRRGELEARMSIGCLRCDATKHRARHVLTVNETCGKRRRDFDAARATAIGRKLAWEELQVSRMGAEGKQRCAAHPRPIPRHHFDQRYKRPFLR